MEKAEMSTSASEQTGSPAQTNSEEPSISAENKPTQESVNVLAYTDAVSDRRIASKALVELILAQGLLKENDLVSLLGEHRHHLTLIELERAIIRGSIVSDTRLAKLKGEISRFAHLSSSRIDVRNDIIDEQTSRQMGIVAIRANDTSVEGGAGDYMSPAGSYISVLPEGSEFVTIAIVEDVPGHLEKVSSSLGVHVQPVVCTVAQFTELHKVAYKGAKPANRTPMSDIYVVFDEAVRAEASDIHLSVGLSPTMRVHGKLIELPYEEIDAAWMRSEVARIGGPARLAKAETDHDVDMAFPYGHARFRVNFGNAKQGLTMAARKIPSRVPTMEDLSLPRAVQAFTGLDRGLVLVTGATGSGKSTTLASILGAIATTQERHIITLEDPIEFILPRGGGVVHQRELGSSFTSFPDGLRQALRQDPDVILVGEMRDIDTVRTAVTAAETGHLVFGTLHTFDAASTVSRIVSMYPTDEQEQIRATLSYTLKGIVSQSLLRLSGRPGRVAAFEVMVSTPGIANNLRRVDGATQLRSSLETGAKDGMQTMDMALAELVRRRLVTQDEALEKSVDPDDLRRRFE